MKKAAAIVATDDSRSSKRPDDLGASVKLTDLKKVDAALKELAWIDARQREISGLIDQEYVRVLETFTRQREFLIGKKKTDFDERSNYLRELVETWAAEHLAEHLPEDSRTLKLEHGTITLKADQPALQLFEGWGDDDVLVSMDSEMEFVEKLKAINETSFGEFVIADFIRIVVSLNRVRILELHKSGTLTDADIEQFGLMRRPPGESINIKAAA